MKCTKRLGVFLKQPNNGEIKDFGVTFDFVTWSPTE